MPVNIAPIAQLSLATLITVGALGYLLLYRTLPPDLLVIWTATVGFYFGHNSAINAADAAIRTVQAVNGKEGNGNG